MSINPEEFDAILEKLEKVMEGVARTLLLKGYGIDTTDYSEKELKKACKEVLNGEIHKNPFEDEEKVTHDELMEQLGQPFNNPKKKGIVNYPEEFKKALNEYQDDPFSSMEVDPYFSFGEMMDELVLLGSAWCREVWDDETHVMKVRDIDNSNDLIVKGKDGKYNPYVPTLEDMLSIDWLIFDVDFEEED